MKMVLNLCDYDLMNVKTLYYKVFYKGAVMTRESKRGEIDDGFLS